MRGRQTRRYVVMWGDLVMLDDWTWARVDYLGGCRRTDLKPVLVWVFRSRRSAERVRRTYGRGTWRHMRVVFVGR